MRILAESLLALLLGALLGYVTGASGPKGFEELAKNARNRVNHLAYFKVVPPMALFRACRTASSFYKEAVQAYILGMPNSSVVMSLKTLELGLKRKLGKENARLVELIDKLEEEPRFKDLAHGLRILRNHVVHGEKGCGEQDALEVLRHVSEILNRLFPFKEVLYRVTCGTCKTSYTATVRKEKSFLGNIIRTKCPNCGMINDFIIGTEWGIPPTR